MPASASRLFTIAAYPRKLLRLCEQQWQIAPSELLAATKLQPEQLARPELQVPLQDVFMLFVRAQQLTAAPDLACDGDHQPDREFGALFGIDALDRRDGNAARCGRRHVDIVRAGSVQRDHFYLRRQCQHGSGQPRMFRVVDQPHRRSAARAQGIEYGGVQRGGAALRKRGFDGAPAALPAADWLSTWASLTFAGPQGPPGGRR